MPAFDDIIGDDYEFIGAPARRGVPRTARQLPQVQQSRQKAAALLNIPQPGMRESGPRKTPLAFPVETFAAGGATTRVLTVQPLQLFKGSKLVIDVARVGTTGGVPIVTRLRVGAEDFLVGNNPIPAAMFGALVEGNELILDTAGPGLPIELTIGVTAAPTGTDVITMASALFGLTWS